jgi:hypothetical protein
VPFSEQLNPFALLLSILLIINNRSLERGGWLELREIHYFPQSEDGPFDSTAQPLVDYFSKITEGYQALGVNIHSITSFPEKLREAGFVNVKTNTASIPISLDNQSKTENGTACLMREIIYRGLQGTALRPLTQGLGWRREEVEVYLAGVRNCLRKGLQDTKLPTYVIYAQRP